MIFFLAGANNESGFSCMVQPPAWGDVEVFKQAKSPAWALRPTLPTQFPTLAYLYTQSPNLAKRTTVT